MDILDSKTREELLRSCLAELAKAQNELSCAHADVKKAQSRVGFLLVLLNRLIEKEIDR